MHQSPVRTTFFLIVIQEVISIGVRKWGVSPVTGVWGSAPRSDTSARRSASTFVPITEPSTTTHHHHYFRSLRVRSVPASAGAGLVLATAIRPLVLALAQVQVLARAGVVLDLSPARRSILSSTADRAAASRPVWCSPPRSAATRRPCARSVTASIGCNRISLGGCIIFAWVL
jgi:hypothetical protein